MTTRRLSDSSTVSVVPKVSNTLWHNRQDPVGLPTLYPAVVQLVSAVDLIAQLEGFKDQHVLYLNAIPHIRKVGEEGVLSKCAAAGDCWKGTHGSDHNTPIVEIAKRYIDQCGPGFGIPEEGLVSLSEQAVSGLPQ